MTAVGIDFGTTNSVVAKWTRSGVDVLEIDDAPGEWALHGFSRVMPSVFAATPEGDAHFGWHAKRAERRPFEAIKRLFATQQEVVSDDQGTAFAVDEVATMIFAELKRRAAHAGVTASRAVVTVPANSRGLARHRTKICAGMSGLEVLALLNEPTAAAMAYANTHPGDQQVLVFDWGGGTLDVTVLRSIGGVFMEQASKGLPTAGGMDFDSRLTRAVLETVSDATTWDPVERHQFRLGIEMAKVELSRQQETEVMLPGGETRRVTREIFERAVRSLVEESRRPLEQCLRDIGTGAGAIDAVVMVGGTSEIPLVRRFVAEVLDQEPVAGIDPMTAIGEGAAVAAAILSGESTSNDFFVATEHALGTLALTPPDPEPRFSVLIPRNRKLPAAATDRFTPVFDDQEIVNVRVIEGDPDLEVDHPENVILTSFQIELPAGNNQSDRSFDITYQYDVDGILHVEVNDGVTGGLMAKHEVTFGITDDKRALVQLSRRAQQTVESGELVDDTKPVQVMDPEISVLLERAHAKVIPFLDARDADRVQEAAHRLEQTAPTDLPGAKRALQEELAPYTYLF